MGRYAVIAVLEATDAEEAQGFVGDMLAAGVRWDRPLEVHYVGTGCEVGDSEEYRTEEIHLLRDGMREVLRPERGSRERGEGGCR